MAKKTAARDAPIGFTELLTIFRQKMNCSINRNTKSNAEYQVWWMALIGNTQITH
jgi:hypothetical protein